MAAERDNFEGKDTLERAKQLLLGAVDTIFQVASKKHSESDDTAKSSDSGFRPAAISVDPTSQVGISGSTTSRTGSSSFGSVGLHEHRRLFKFQPLHGTKRGKGPGGAPPKAKRGKRRGPATWKKECVCLTCHDQTWPPSTEERMELARVGLGLKELQFGVEDGAEQIHQRFLSKYPLLEAAGGYTLLRCADSSRVLVDIETPESGLTIPYLKDIVRQKLYIRPLQCDLECDDVKPTAVLVRLSVGECKSLEMVSPTFTKLVYAMILHSC